MYAFNLMYFATQFEVFSYLFLLRLATFQDCDHSIFLSQEFLPLFQV